MVISVGCSASREIRLPRAVAKIEHRTGLSAATSTQASQMRQVTGRRRSEQSGDEVSVKEGNRCLCSLCDGWLHFARHAETRGEKTCICCAGFHHFPFEEGCEPDEAGNSGGVILCQDTAQQLLGMRREAGQSFLRSLGINRRDPGPAPQDRRAARRPGLGFATQRAGLVNGAVNSQLKVVRENVKSLY
jgi:hypothetical protein